MRLHDDLLHAGRADREIAPLVTAYVELAPGPWSPDEQKGVAIAAARACDLPRLEALARAVRDPFPWAVFLDHLLAIAPTERTSDVERCVSRLYRLAEQMLRRQGVSLVRPEDVLRREPPYQTMLRELLADEHDLNSTPALSR